VLNGDVTFTVASRNVHDISGFNETVNFLENSV